MEVHMRWIRGSAFFILGAIAGMFITQPSAAPQANTTGVKLNHVGLFVKDLDESTNFYTKKMGFRQAFSFKDAAGKPIVYLQMSRDTFLELTPIDADHPAGVSHAGIWSDDVKLTVASLKENGVKVEDVHVGGTKAPLANMFDPNGVRLELLSYPPESLQRKAIDAWK
jgi:catechol 2,3-dioxygenase-like lactoylglutathione lyase family enzyme